MASWHSTVTSVSTGTWSFPGTPSSSVMKTALDAVILQIP
jgi:hypothetical protein